MRSLMRSNLLRVAVLVWFSGWLLMVMPGHKRGIVQLPDAELAKASCCEPAPPACCDVPASCCDTSPAEGEPVEPIDPAKHCAICFLKAHLTNPPPLTLYTPYLGELDELAYLLEDDLAAPRPRIERHRGRAPPA